MAHDRQAQSQAPVGSRHRVIRLDEAVEELRQHLRTDAHAAVRNGDLNMLATPLEAHRDPAALRGELDGVGEQVGDDLLQPGRVPVDETHRVIDAILDPDGLGLRGSPHQIQSAPNHHLEIDGTEVEQELPRCDARDVEQVVDELRPLASPSFPLSPGVSNGLQEAHGLRPPRSGGSVGL